MIAQTNSSRAYQKRKWYLAAFLNLLVLPGTGSLVLGKRLPGFIQIGFSFLGMVLLTFSFQSVLNWLVSQWTDFSNIYDSRLVPLSAPKHIAFLDYLFIGFEEGVYPDWYGIPSLVILGLSFVVFLIVWIYSLISLLQVRTKLK